MKHFVFFSAPVFKIFKFYLNQLLVEPLSKNGDPTQRTNWLSWTLSSFCSKLRSPVPTTPWIGSRWVTAQQEGSWAWAMDDLGLGWPHTQRALCRTACQQVTSEKTSESSGMEPQPVGTLTDTRPPTRSLAWGSSSLAPNCGEYNSVVLRISNTRSKASVTGMGLLSWAALMILMTYNNTERKVLTLITLKAMWEQPKESGWQQGSLLA